jgi:UDP-N-acetylmuramate--alanine ligase
VRGSARELHVVKDLSLVAGAVADLARPGDLVVTLGAGSIGTVGDRVMAALTKREVAP